MKITGVGESSLPKSKSDMVREALALGQNRRALQIAKTFRLGMSPEERSQVVRGYECLVRPEFYKQLGMEPVDEVSKAVAVLKWVVARSK